MSHPILLSSLRVDSSDTERSIATNMLNGLGNYRTKADPEEIADKERKQTKLLHSEEVSHLVQRLTSRRAACQRDPRQLKIIEQLDRSRGQTRAMMLYACRVTAPGGRPNRSLRRIPAVAPNWVYVNSKRPSLLPLDCRPSTLFN